MQIIRFKLLTVFEDVCNIYTYITIYIYNIYNNIYYKLICWYTDWVNPKYMLPQNQLFSTKKLKFRQTFHPNAWQKKIVINNFKNFVSFCQNAWISIFSSKTANFRECTWSYFIYQINGHYNAIWDRLTCVYSHALNIFTICSCRTSKINGITITPSK